MNPQSSTDSNSPFFGDDAISRRAYELWEREGRPEGSDLRHWLQAEQELGAHAATSTSGETQIPSNNTGNDVQPLEGTRAASAVSRSPKRGSSSPFGERTSQGSQSTVRRKG